MREAYTHISEIIAFVMDTRAIGIFENLYTQEKIHRLHETDI